MFQNGFYVSLRKTKIVGVDELAHQLPPDLGPFREFKVADWFCPDEWSKDGIFVPVREGEPLWFDLRLNPECACLCAVQRVNPVTGDPANLEAGLTKDPGQNYLALPIQRWLDGYAKEGKVYQFVVTKEGVGLAVSEFVLPKHMQDSHAIGFAFYAPKVERPRPAPVPRSGGWAFTPDGPRKAAGSSPMWFSPLHSSPTIGGIADMSSSCHDGPITAKEVKALREKTGLPMMLCKKALVETKGDMSAAYNNIATKSSGPSKGVMRSSGIMHGLYEPLGTAGEEPTYGGAGGLSCSAGAAAGACDELMDLASDFDDAPRACFLDAPYDGEGLVAAGADVEIADVETVDMLERSETFDKAAMGAGGRIGQRIEPDDNTVEYYQEKPVAVLTVYLALPGQFASIMKKGKRQDADRKDKYKMSGQIGGIQVPLIRQEVSA